MHYNTKWGSTFLSQEIAKVYAQRKLNDVSKSRNEKCKQGEWMREKFILFWFLQNP